MKLDDQFLPQIKVEWEENEREETCPCESKELCDCKVKKIQLVLDAFQHALKNRKHIKKTFLESNSEECNNNNIKIRRTSISNYLLESYKTESYQSDISYESESYRPKLDPDTDQCFRRILFASVVLLLFLMFVLFYSLYQRIK
jgi:hypothetical protein